MRDAQFITETIDALKSVKESFTPSMELLDEMETFRLMVNDCIRIGLKNDASTLKTLGSLCYPMLSKYKIPSYYKQTVVSHVAGIMTNRKKSRQRGIIPGNPYAKVPLLKAYLGFRISDGKFKIPLVVTRNGLNTRYEEIPLTRYVRGVLSDPSIRIRAFKLSINTLGICYSRKLELIEPEQAIGIDRNLANVTVGNSKAVIAYDLTKTVQIAENHRSVIRAFRRNDARISGQLNRKHGKRRTNRIKQQLHLVSQSIVKVAKDNKAAIVFEDIRHIRKLYTRGNNHKGPNQRFKMNSWPFYMLKEQITYKAAWQGIPVIQLTKSETRGTSKLCPRCGKRTQVAGRYDWQHKRQLWCKTCERWQDRDVIAAMNIARKGWLRFDHPQGAAGEAMVQEPGSLTPVILKVDAAKLSLRTKQNRWHQFNAYEGFICAGCKPIEKA